VVRALLICALAMSASCVRGGGSFRCVEDSECTLNGLSGVCSVGYCAFPDPECESGFRYGSHSGNVSSTCAQQQISTEVTVGGEVTNLVGSNLVLRNNGGDDLLITASGSYEFSDPVVTGDPYEVTVAAQPSNPEQTCTVANGTGTAGSTKITDVAVDCATATYTVGGTVLGLVGTGLVLTNNGGNDKSVTGTGNVPFMFSTAVASGTAFDVQIKTQPSGQTCSVSGNTGTVGAANITSVVVNCMAGTFTVGGTVSGLQGTVVLKNNNTDTATVTANGSFAFPTPLATTTNYSVTVGTNPSYPPRSQTCMVTSGATGQVGSANVTSVMVACTTNSFTVGGTITGLTGTLVIKNGTDTLSLPAGTTMFTFGAAVLSGNTYNVQVMTQPSGQTCAINSATGTVANGNVTNVSISCSAGGDPGILCGSVYCNPAALEICCITSGVPACSATCNGGGTVPIHCDDQQDCVAQGKPTTVCCGSVNGNVVNNIYCGGQSQCEPPKAFYCDPNVANPCPNGGTCTATMYPFPGYYRCF